MRRLNARTFQQALGDEVIREWTVVWNANRAEPSLTGNQSFEIRLRGMHVPREAVFQTEPIGLTSETHYPGEVSNHQNGPMSLDQREQSGSKISLRWLQLSERDKSAHEPDRDETFDRTPIDTLVHAGCRYRGSLDTLDVAGRRTHRGNAQKHSLRNRKHEWARDGGRSEELKGIDEEESRPK